MELRAVLEAHVKSSSVSRKLITCLVVFTLNAQVWPMAPQVVLPRSASRVTTLPGETATRLPNGGWLLLGGESKNGVLGAATVTASNTGTAVTLTQTMNFARAWHTATVLPNGTVLVLGGTDARGNVVQQAEIFDPSSMTFHLQTVNVIPRTHHAAALLTDGRLLLAGGIDAKGDPVSAVEIWDPRSGNTTIMDAELPIARLNDHPSLLADGTLLLWGGTDLQGNLLDFGEIYDPAGGRFLATTTTESLNLDLTLPFLESSLPEDGTTGVPVDALIALRFSKLLRPDTVNPNSIVVRGPDGPVQCLTIPAENGRLAFLTSRVPLLPGTAYTVSIRGALDEQHLPVVYKTVSFTTTGENTGSKPTNSKAKPPAKHERTNDLPKAPQNVTAVAGRVLKLDGSPLPNATLRIKSKSVRSDRTGVFLLTNVPPGQQDLVIDGRSANTPGHTFGVFETGIQAQAGQTIVLPFAIWMTELDTAHAVQIQFPTTKEVVVTTPTLPGLEFHIPPNAVITDIDGKVATQISITPIPVKQPPFPLPQVEVPIYFTIQPGGGSIWVNGSNSGMSGARLVYPNSYNWPTGRSVDFWNYDPYTARGWYVYGEGKVSSDRKSIIPDPGTEIYQLTGAMVAGPGWGPPNGPPPSGGPQGGNPSGGEPVDLSTGLFIYEKTDLSLPDVIPISLTRIYRNGDTATRAFGIGTTLPYDMFIVGNLNDLSWVELVLPTGGRVRFDRTQGNFWNNSTLQCVNSPGEFYGATFTTSAPGFSGSGAFWVITLRDGTVLRFLQPGNFGAANYQGIGLSSITDRNGNTVNIIRNSNNYITQIQSPNGRWIQLNYDTNNPPRVTSAQDNLGRTIIYYYDPVLGTLKTVTDANGGLWTYGYDTSDEMTSITDARQILYLQNIYVSGRVHQQILGYPSMVYTFNYATDANNNVIQTSVTDPNGSVRQVTFASPPTYPDGVFISGGYATTDIRALGRPEQQVLAYALQPTTSFLLSETDSLNRTTAYTYDGLGNVSSVTALAGTPSAVTSFFTHDPSFSQITSTTDPLNHMTTFGLDSHGNVLSATDALGNTSLYARDQQGRVVTAADPLGNAWQMAYYGADLTAVTDPYGGTIGIVPDEAGRVVAITDPMGQTERLQYNPLNRVTQKTDTLGGVTAFAWDANSNLHSVTDARNTQNPTIYSYDNVDRLALRTDPLGKQESFGYDNNSNLNCYTDRRGQVTNILHDGLNRLTSIGYGATSCSSTTYQSTTAYTYDAGGRPTKIVDSISGTTTPVFDGLNRILSETSAQGSVSYLYDAAGRQTTMTVAGQPSVSYSYDNANRLIQIAQGSSTVILGYDADSHRTSLSLPNGVTLAYTYDKDSRLMGINYNQGTSPMGNLLYSYDGDGRIAQVSGSFARTGLPVAVTSASYDSANRLTAWGTNSSFSYDANGNLQGDGTNTYVWDARNQLSSITGGVTASFQYDPFGRRTSKTIAGTTTGFLYDGFDVTQESAAGSPTANLLNGGTDEVFSRTTTSANSFLSDRAGSSSVLTDALGDIATQYTYEPYGNTTASGTASTNSFQYTGRENDGSGLYFYRARYYNPVIGRFISQDPLGSFSGLSRYSYAGDDPIDYSDSSGLLISPRHYDITRDAALNAGYSPEDAAALAQAVVDVDSLPGTQDTSAASANQHAMAGRKANGNYQNPCQAYNGAAKEIGDDIEQGDQAAIAKALHIIQDARSPAHGPFAPWDGGSTIYLSTGPFSPPSTISNVPSLSHMMGDTFPGSDAIQDATVTSQQFLKDMMSHDSALNYPSNYLPANPCQ
jgi:RHS repeat-associated protein